MQQNVVKMKWRTRLIFGLLGGAFHAGALILWNAAMDGGFTEKEIYSGIFQGLVMGLFWFLIAPAIFRGFGNKKMKQIDAKYRQQMEEEGLVYQGPANLFKGFEGVGGVLYLSKERLFFASHKMNIQSGETSIALEDIKEVLPRKTAGIINNGLRIKAKTPHNTIKFYDFVVNERDEWLWNIKEQLKN